MNDTLTPPPPPGVEPVRVISQSPRSPKKFLIIGAIAAILLGGIGTAIFLISRQQRVAVEAWDCIKYNFSVSRTGEVTVDNQSARNEPPQKVSISIDGSPVALLDVPAVSQGQSAVIGTVTVPESGVFTWEAVGTTDCRDSGSYVTEITPTPTTPVLPSVTPTETIPITQNPKPSVTPTTPPDVTPSPTDEPGITPTTAPDVTPTSTPAPTTPPNNPNGCGGSCGSDYNCQADLTCHAGLCRRPACPDSESCACAPPPPDVSPSPTSVPLASVPATGSIENTWALVSGSLLLIGIGLLLAL